MDCSDSRDPPAPRRNNWIFIDEEQAFAGAREQVVDVAGASESSTLVVVLVEDGADGNRGAYSSAGTQRLARGRGAREFRSEDLQRGKPRRRNVSETPQRGLRI